MRSGRHAFLDSRKRRGRSAHKKGRPAAFLERCHSSVRIAALGAGAAALCAASAFAQTTAPVAAPAAPADPYAANLLGGLWGLRPFASQYGVSLTLQEQSEILGNVSGGQRRGFDYDGLTTATLQIDSQAAFGWAGGQFNVSALQIHGRNLSADDLLSLQTASGIEADRATRLWELWYQQKFLDDKIDVRLGQMSLDQEFMVSKNAGYFVNTSFGWPTSPSFDMPGGGPAYPLSALGARVALHPSETLTLLAAIVNGSPSPSHVGDPQMRNPSGTSFPLNGGALAIAEAQLAYPFAGAATAGGAQPLAGLYKIGVWYDSERLADLRYDNMGLSLANPASTGIAATHRGDYGLYAVADQMIYRWSDDPGRNVSFFVRPSFAPQQDRNLIDFSLNAGLAAHGLVAGRNDDVLALGVAYALVSNSAAGAAFDQAFFNPGVYAPARRQETVLEATYQLQVTPWCQIQPDFQYVFNPGAGIVNPNCPAEKLKDEAVVGVRATITF
jgi:porin